jgi:hypothetical protein
MLSGFGDLGVPARQTRQHLGRLIIIENNPADTE